VYYIYNPNQKFHHAAITFDKFKEMEIDVIISSYLGHYSVYYKLLREHKPNAAYIIQMGNSWMNSLDYSYMKNIMASTVDFPVPAGINVLNYHQEFPLSIFNYTDPIPTNNISSLVQNMSPNDVYFKVKNSLPEYNFKAYGNGSPDSHITGLENVAQVMKNSLFGFHNKPQDDAYGHIIHNWFAVGRPPIVNYSTAYKHRLAGKLMIPDETCIDIDVHNIKAMCDKIRYFSHPERHRQMCDNIRRKFQEQVNFDEEANKLASFLERLR
jgi:hypothetical protein